MKRIVLVTTGGTISTRKETATSGAVPQLTGEDLLEQVPPLQEVAQLEVAPVVSVPGAYMTLNNMLQTARLVEEHLARDEVDGVVVTHGTDTIDETAYLLDLTIRSSKPVVVMGSMRNISMLSFDGLRNLYDAVRVAATPEAGGRGTMVVLNEEIHSARFVTKVHAQKVETFQSPLFGALGVIYEDGPRFYQTPHRPRLLEKKLEPAVDLLRMSVDCSDKFLRYAVDTGAKGLVLELLGGGRAHPPILPAIQGALDADVIVVAAPRTLAGTMSDPYGYEGAAADLKARGVLFGDHIPGHKCRIRLMLALANFPDHNALRAYWNEPYHS